MKYISSMIGNLLGLIVVAAWMTHIYVTVSFKAWGLMALGIIAFPIGILHGVFTWFGFDWIN